MIVTRRKAVQGFGDWGPGQKIGFWTRRAGCTVADRTPTDDDFRWFATQEYGARCNGMAAPQALVTNLLNRRRCDENELRAMVVDYLAANPCQRASAVVQYGTDEALRIGAQLYRDRHGVVPPDSLLDEIEDATANGALVGRPYLDSIVRTKRAGTPSTRAYRILGIPTPAEEKAAADKAKADAKAAADAAKAAEREAERLAREAADADARAKLFGAKPAGLPSWAIPAGIGAVVVVGGVLFFALRRRS